MADTYICVSTCVLRSGVHLKRGERRLGTDPIVKAHPGLFVRETDVDERPVESATRAPGEKRMTRRG